jgi:hypothetical protein
VSAVELFQLLACMHLFVGMMEACMISEVTDGASNVREVWKLSYK